MLLGNALDFLPLCLKRLELTHIGSSLLCLLDKRLQLFKKLLLNRKVLLHLLFLCGNPGVALCLNHVHYLLEGGIKLILLWNEERLFTSLLDKGLVGCLNLGCTHAVELHFEAFCLGLAAEHIIALSNSFQALNNLLTASRSCAYVVTLLILYGGDFLYCLWGRLFVAKLGRSGIVSLFRGLRDVLFL